MSRSVESMKTGTRDRALAYVHIPKAGGTTINQILAQSYGTKHCSPRPLGPHHAYYTAADLRRLRWLYPRIRSVGGHRVRYFSNLHRYFQDRGFELYYFTFVRDPVKRLVSQFRHHQRMYSIRNPQSFFAHPRMRNAMVGYLVGDAPASRAVDAIHESRFLLVGLQEEFDVSLLLLKKLYGDPMLDIKYVRPENVAPTEHHSYTSVLSAEIMEMIKEYNQEDIKFYQYVRDFYFPSMLRVYGESLETDLAEFQCEKRSIQNTYRYRAWVLKDKVNLLYGACHSDRIWRLLRIKKRVRTPTGMR